MAGKTTESSRQKSDLARQIGSVSPDQTAAVELPSPGPVGAATVRAMDTAELVDEVVRAGYDGPAWTELEQRLVRRALPDLEHAIRTGAVYGRCARAGASIERRPALQTGSYPEDIAAEAVEECLGRFRTRVLPEGQWDPEQGTSLEDFFCVCCLPDLANRWRWYLRRLPEVVVSLDGEVDGAILTLAIDPGPGPAEIANQKALVAEALAAMTEGDRVTFVMLADGWSPTEIARMLGMARNTLDARISRARKSARARRTP